MATTYAISVVERSAQTETFGEQDKYVYSVDKMTIDLLCFFPHLTYLKEEDGIEKKSLGKTYSKGKRKLGGYNGAR